MKIQNILAFYLGPVAPPDSSFLTATDKEPRLLLFFKVPTVNEDTGDGNVAIKFSGQTLSNKSLVLVTMKVSASCDAELTVNCERLVVGNMLSKEIKQQLEE